MDTRSLELINLELDQRLSAVDRLELSRRLAADSELRARRLQLQGMMRTLGDAPTLEMPAEFRLQMKPPKASPVRPSRKRYRVPLALAASGLLAIVALPWLLPQVTGPVSQLTGAFAPALPTLDARSGPAGLELTMDVPAGPAAELMLEFGPAAAPLVATTDSAVTVKVEGRRIVVSGLTAGRTKLTVQGAGSIEWMSARLMRDGKVIHITP